MKAVFFAMSFLLSGLCHARQSLVDSLYHELQNTSLTDSSRIDFLNELAFELSASAPQEGLRLAMEAEKLATQVKDRSRVARAINNQGVNHWAMGNDSLAEVAYLSIVSIHLQDQNLKSLGITYNNLALLAYNSSDFAKALEYHRQAGELFQRLGLKRNYSQSLSNMGVIFLAIPDYPKALEFFLRSLESLEDQDSLPMANAYSNLGLVYANLDEPETALTYQLKAGEIYRLSGNLQGVANTLANEANILTDQGKFEMAKSRYLEALAINRKIGNPRRIASDFSNLGTLSVRADEPLMAWKYLKSADSIYSLISDPGNQSLTKLELAKLVDLPGITTQKGKEDRLSLQLLALDLARKAGTMQQSQQAYAALADTYEMQGKHGLALAAFKQSSILKDSVFNEDSRKKILQQQAGFDYGLREKELKAALEKEKLTVQAESAAIRANRKWIILASIFIVTAGTGFGLLYQKRKQAEYNATMKILELKALKAQMNPHFIFNALNSISLFIGNNDKESAEGYLMKFSRLIRMILEYADQKEVTLNEELELLGLYLQIESLRMRHKPVWQITMNKSIDPENTLIPPLLLQPIIENCLWHGLSQLEHPGEIKLHFARENDNLHITIADNGIGRTQYPLKTSIKKQSLGLKITTERLALLKKTPDNGHFIEIMDLNPGLEINLRIPYVQQF